MKTKSIILCTSDVQAVQAGLLTRFYKPVKPQPPSDVTHINRLGSGFVSAYPNGAIKPFDWQRKSPFQRRDALYVREKYREYCHVDESGYTHFDDVRVDYYADDNEEIYLYDADGFHELAKDGSEKFVPWKSPVTMPRVAARIFLEVTDVTCEKQGNLWYWVVSFKVTKSHQL